MASEMTNIEIRDFMTVSGASNGDFVVLSLSGGTSAKIAVGVFRSTVAQGITPSIRDGYWWIGEGNTEVVAEGKTPEFRKGQLGVEWKYTYESETAWRLLVALDDILFEFDDLTPEQRDMIKLKFEDLTQEEIAELQKPASDMISVLEKTNKDVQAAEDSRAKEFATLKTESVAATGSAQDTADHPTYIGEDNYVYQWNKTSKTYNRTSIYVRGEAFSIKKVYASVTAMQADKSTSFKEGDFCLINTGDVENPENAQLYVRTSYGAWEFLVDMSGAIGFTGKVPQLFIGTVSVGNGKTSAAVTLTPAGTDTDGNPKFNINYVIPCLAYEDLTMEQIEELQRPASEMILQLQATDSSVKEAESARAADYAGLRVDMLVATEGAREAAEAANASSLQADTARDAANESAARAESSAVGADVAASRADSSADYANTAAAGADVAAMQANSARDAANESAARADSSAAGADDAAEGAIQSASRATKAAEDAELAASGAAQAAIQAEAARDAANTAAARAESSAVGADAAAGNANGATREARDAAKEARNIPVIKDGTWWVYDIATGEYTDTGSPATSRSPKVVDGIWWTWNDSEEKYESTGWAVNSDFELTKEKIEGVFTGDIESHTHDHVRYRAQMYDETPDFAALTEWTDGLGQHPFRIGNEIYVRNESEPTGYANYKLSPSPQGNVWVRIPQVPAGWKVVLVRE